MTGRLKILRFGKGWDNSNAQMPANAGKQRDLDCACFVRLLIGRNRSASDALTFRQPLDQSAPDQGCGMDKNILAMAIRRYETVPLLGAVPFD